MLRGGAKRNERLCEKSVLLVIPKSCALEEDFASLAVTGDMKWGPECFLELNLDTNVKKIARRTKPVDIPVR